MNWHHIFHFFTAHSHYDGDTKVPVKNCKDGSTVRRAVYHCCKCKLYWKEDPYAGYF